MKKELKKYEEIYTNKNFKLLTVVFSIAALAITFINNINIDIYIKKFIIPVTILIVSYIFIAEKINVVKNRKSYYCLIPIFLILFSYLFIKIDISNMVLNVVFIPILLTIFFLTLVNKEYNLCRRFLLHLIKLFPNRLFSNLDYLELLKKEKSDNKNKNTFNILIGCIIGIPIALILLALLSGADKYFSTFINEIIIFIQNIVNFKNLVPNIFILLISFICLFSIFVNILKNRSIENKQAKLRNSNISIVSTILIIVNLVFVLFLISEISKLTTNFLHLPIEYTYAEYAREGFFQLLFVTLINISIIIYFIYYTTILNNKNVKKLILILITFSILLIFNSYYRMFLYISAYGLTVLRLQVVFFLAMEFLIFSVMIKKIVSGIKNNELFIYMIIVLITYTINVYMCSNAFIEFINKI